MTVETFAAHTGPRLRDIRAVMPAFAGIRDFLALRARRPSRGYPAERPGMTGETLAAHTAAALATSSTVMPAFAGIHDFLCTRRFTIKSWMPAKARA